MALKVRFIAYWCTLNNFVYSLIVRTLFYCHSFSHFVSLVLPNKHSSTLAHFSQFVLRPS